MVWEYQKRCDVTAPPRGWIRRAGRVILVAVK